jgi:hypothetical protein
MKKVVLSAICFILTLAAFAQNRTLQAVNFDGETYNLAYSVQDSGGSWLNEYLRGGDGDLNNYEKLIGVRYYENSKLSHMDIAKATAANVVKKYPWAKYSLLENKNTGEILLDFFIWEGDIVEFNAFKLGMYKGYPVSLQFVRRWYKDEGMELFKKTFKELRPRLVNVMAGTPIPDPQKVIKK